MMWNQMFMSSPLKAMQAKNLEMTSARRGPRPLNSYAQPLGKEKEENSFLDD